MRGVGEYLARHGVPGHPRAGPGGGEGREGGAGLASTGGGQVGARPGGAGGGGRDSGQLKLEILVSLDSLDSTARLGHSQGKWPVEAVK